MSLINKIAVVTGGSSGIGAAVALKFVQEGAQVVIVGRNKEKLKNVSDTCHKFGKKPLTIVADITKEDEVSSIIPTTIKNFGKLDILVNNAGIGGITDILHDDVMANYEKVMATNLNSAVRLTNIAAKHLVESKGNIIFTSSVMSTIAMENSFAYCVSKAALDSFSRCIAVDLSTKGVRVNSVNPGPVRTDIFDALDLSAEEKIKLWETVKTKTLSNRVSDAEEIADLVVFVVSDKGKSITGTQLIIDNGMRYKIYK